MNSAERTHQTLLDILRFAELAERLVARGRSAYSTDEMLPLAAEAVVLKLGEAVGRLPSALIAANTDVQFAEARGMRNVITHRYELVDHNVLWTALSVDIPLLARQVAAILRDNQPMTEPQHDASSDRYADAPLEVLEDDETVPPRPEEELADLERSEPDPR